MKNIKTMGAAAMIGLFLPLSFMAQIQGAVSQSIIDDLREEQGQLMEEYLQLSEEIDEARDAWIISGSIEDRNIVNGLIKERLLKLIQIDKVRIAIKYEIIKGVGEFETLLPLNNERTDVINDGKEILADLEEYESQIEESDETTTEGFQNLKELREDLVWTHARDLRGVLGRARALKIGYNVESLYDVTAQLKDAAQSVGILEDGMGATIAIAIFEAQFLDTIVSRVQEGITIFTDITNASTLSDVRSRARSGDSELDSAANALRTTKEKIKELKSTIEALIEAAKRTSNTGTTGITNDLACTNAPKNGECQQPNPGVAIEPGTNCTVRGYGGKYEAGLCKGGTDRRCCVPNTPDRIPSVSTNDDTTENTNVPQATPPLPTTTEGNEVNTPTPVPTILPKPTVSILANGSGSDITVSSGASATIKWTSLNTTSCVASGSWSGGRATSGSTSVGPLTSSKTYVITCVGWGNEARDTIKVNVLPAGVI